MKEQLQKILDKNPEAIAKFASYYKYSFSFTCEEIHFSIGGDSGDIYRLSVNPEMPLSDLIDWIED
jgi:hypothetical protein